MRLRLIEITQGADDDGSGTVTILESYRALIASSFKPQRPVEFHWYSAEVCAYLPYVKHYSSQIRRVVFLGRKRLPKLTRRRVSRSML